MPDPALPDPLDGVLRAVRHCGVSLSRPDNRSVQLTLTVAQVRAVVQMIERRQARQARRRKQTKDG